MDLIQTDVLKEQRILEKMVAAEARHSGKMFTIEALTRILRKVPREIAIGAIIKSALFKRNELEEELDNLLGNIFDTVLPHYLYDILKKAVPQFIVDLKIILIIFVFRWLYKLPGLDLPIDLEPTYQAEATPPPVEIELPPPEEEPDPGPIEIDEELQDKMYKTLWYIGKLEDLIDRLYKKSNSIYDQAYADWKRANRLSQHDPHKVRWLANAQGRIDAIKSLRSLFRNRPEEPIIITEDDIKEV